MDLIARGDTIYIDSVASTRRAAIVNWLVAVKGIAITIHHGDEDIERIWRDLTPDGRTICATVNVGTVGG